MGIFDFFKRKNNTTPKQETTKTKTSEKISDTTTDKIPEITTDKTPKVISTYNVASKYNEYTKLFINFMANGNYAPIAAYEQADGNIIGYLYMYSDDDTSYMLSTTDAIGKMKEELAKRMEADSIRSYAIYYHSLFDADGNHAIADDYDQPKAISIVLTSNTGFHNTVAIPYQFDDEGFSLAQMTDVTPEEFQEILNTPLAEAKDYFQERIVIKGKTHENEHGVTIKSVNNRSVGDLWSGIFGFEHFQTMAHDFMMQYIALTQTKGIRLYAHDALEIQELNFEEMAIRVVSEQERMITAFPNIETHTKIDVTLNQIDEWEHVENLEATVYGAGRDQFAIRFYATDYAFNREKYLSNTTVQMKISGIIYVLDKHSNTDMDIEGNKVDAEFCMYMPGQEWAEYGCFDFIGKVETMQQVNAFDIEAHKGYILKIKLINNADIPDYFTIDMFVNTKNMRFEASELRVGMFLTGMFQMLGEITE